MSQQLRRKLQHSPASLEDFIKGLDDHLVGSSPLANLSLPHTPLCIDHYSVIPISAGFRRWMTVPPPPSAPPKEDEAELRASLLPILAIGGGQVQRMPQVRNAHFCRQARVMECASRAHFFPL